jgi:hypothetical protein
MSRVKSITDDILFVKENNNIDMRDENSSARNNNSSLRGDQSITRVISGGRRDEKYVVNNNEGGFRRFRGSDQKLSEITIDPLTAGPYEADLLFRQEIFRILSGENNIENIDDFYSQFYNAIMTSFRFNKDIVSLLPTSTSSFVKMTKRLKMWRRVINYIEGGATTLPNNNKHRHIIVPVIEKSKSKFRVVQQRPRKVGRVVVEGD